MCYYEREASEFSLALLEKAYLKLYGDQYFPHNPSIDIHYLTNWIPETVYFDDLSNKESLWTRLLQNFRDQNIIICMQEIEEGKNYFYAVLDLIEYGEG
jgi:transcription initiation factor IIE alpha subunit